MEFSKRILIASWIVTLVLTSITVLLSFLQIDATEVGMLAALSWGEVTAVQAGYLWKAKHENKIKLTKSMVKAWADEYGFESVSALAQALITD